MRPRGWVLGLKAKEEEGGREEKFPNTSSKRTDHADLGESRIS